MNKKLRRLLALLGIGLAGLVAACASLRDFSIDDLCSADKMPVFDSEGGFRCVPRTLPGPTSPVPSPTAVPSPITPPTPSPSPTPAPSPSPTSTPSPVPVPVPTPTPAQCVDEPPMPAEPVSVMTTTRGFVAVGTMRLAPSSCEEPGENSKCFRDQANGGASVPWEQDERDCWSYPKVTEAFLGSESGRVPVTLGGITMLCTCPTYPNADSDCVARHCADAYGRKYRWAGSAWEECWGSDCRQPRDRASNWQLGYCPARAPKTCEPTPAPTATPTPGHGATCSLPAMPECGGRQDGSEHTDVWGCCLGSKAAGFPSASPFSAVLEEVQAAEERDQTVRRDQDGRVDEDAYVNEILRRLQARGLCAKRSVNPSEEIGIKATNGENWQFDLVLSNGRPRRHGYTAYCKPARF